MTEASSFHVLLRPPQISRTLLVLVSYGSFSFCNFVCHLLTSSSAVFSCISTCPYQWNSLCGCYPQLMDGHWWDKPTAHSRWEQIVNRPPQPGSHLHPDPQEMLNTLKAKRLQHGRQGNAFPGSAESAGERQCCSVIRGQRPHSCKL